MEHIWGEVIEEAAPGASKSDLSWMIPFWESFTDCVIELDAQNKVTSIRRKADSLLVFPDIIGKSFPDIAAKKDREFVLQNLNQLKDSAVTYARFQFLSVLDRYYRWTLIPFYKDGEYSGCHGVAVDVTEQTKKEITLNWQRAVMEQGRDFVGIIDTKGRVLYVNPGGYAMTGVEPSTVIPLERILTPKYLKTIREEGMKEVREHGFWVGRGELVNLDGKVIPIEHSMFSINDEKGEIILFANIIRDISEFLEHERMLEEALKAAEAANIAKSDFLSNMSHEIRTPINAIIGMINIGMNTDDIEKKDYCFMRADNAARHLLSLINDILDMSKIEADKLELSFHVFDFEKTLRNISSIANVRAEEKYINFIVNLGEDVPAFLLCDEMRLSQVITNLLTNAIKFTPEEGTVSLNIEKTYEKGDDIELRFEIVDTGIGISEEQQEKLFTSFNQADTSISQKYGGTGLGLAISKRIVELMDGKIWIESELDKGSKFIFTIKTKKVEKEIYESEESNKKNVPKRRYEFKDKTILIAEDIDINREIMSSILEGSGITDEYAENGKIAVSMFEENPEKYDLILMDINMPEMNGYDATRQIRTFANGKNIPIIAMTANVFREDIEKCLNSGMNDHTGKPIDIDKLFLILNKYLNNGGA